MEWNGTGRNEIESNEKEGNGKKRNGIGGTRIEWNGMVLDGTERS